MSVHPAPELAVRFLRDDRRVSCARISLCSAEWSLFYPQVVSTNFIENTYDFQVAASWKFDHLWPVAAIVVSRSLWKNHSVTFSEKSLLISFPCVKKLLGSSNKCNSSHTESWRRLSFFFSFEKNPHQKSQLCVCDQCEISQKSDGPHTELGSRVKKLFFFWKK